MAQPTILILGAGTWGLSTALALSRRAHILTNPHNITLLDAHSIPSPVSAGNDINKILELSSSAPLGGAERTVSDKLARNAIRGWRDDPVFRGLFHETGAVCAASSKEGVQALEEGDGYANPENGWVSVQGAEAFRATMPEGVLMGEFEGWKGWWKRDGCGWVEARKGLENMAKEAERLGVQFVTGERGRVVELVYDDGDVKGAKTASGEVFRADWTVMCLGAHAPGVFDFQNQLRPTAWTLAHIRLSKEEARNYRDLPVLFNVERGFFMEPDEENCDLKICDEHPGYVNLQEGPFAKHQIPKEAEERIRSFLRDTMPHLADRPFSFARICWCADTPDRAFLISRHPDHPSLVLGVGGSGHGYSYAPVIGEVIADCLEERMDPEMEQRFRWRPETAVNRDWSALQDRFGPPGSNHVMNLGDVKDWTEIPLATVSVAG